MSELSPSPFVIEQCLFGYNEGHGLLASSVRLSAEDISLLEILSDVVPGARFGHSDGYWTGFPIPNLRAYALLRTWPAPEMPRPGCVWTHALLVNADLIGRIPDLATLSSHVARPRFQNGFDAYSQSIAGTFPEQESDVALPMEPSFSPRLHDLATDILSGLYDSRSTTLVPGNPGDLDALIFRIWTQQWPRLRRNFRFQSATTSRPDRITAMRFDLQVTTNDFLDVRRKSPRTKNDASRDWLEVAVADLPNRSTSPFRRFLRAYGKDVKRPKSSFRPLAETFAASRRSLFLFHSTLFDTLEKVGRHFPTMPDARELKTGLLGFPSSEERLLPSSDIVTVLQFLGRSEHASAYPELPLASVDALVAAWPERTSEIVSLADEALRSADVRNTSLLLEVVQQCILPQQFWALTADKPRLQAQILKRRPALLDAKSVSELPASKLLEILEVVPVTSKQAQLMLGRLMETQEPELLAYLLRRFPSEGITAFVGYLDGIATHARLPDALQLVVQNHAVDILNENVLLQATKFSTLLALARALGITSEAVLDAGIRPWQPALTLAAKNVEVADALTMGSFLVAICFVKPEPSAEIIFEALFGAIDSALNRSVLPYEASRILERVLPDLGWSSNWDWSRRFRVGISNAYIHGNLSLESFRKLSDDRKVQRQLLKIVADSPEGGAWLKSARANRR